MARLRIYDEAMTPLQRRQRSDADRKARGEHRLTVWLDVNANAALKYLIERDGKLNTGEHAEISGLVGAALVLMAQAEGMTERKQGNLKRAILREQGGIESGQAAQNLRRMQEHAAKPE